MRRIVFRSPGHAGDLTGSAVLNRTLLRRLLSESLIFQLRTRRLSGDSIIEELKIILLKIVDEMALNIHAASNRQRSRLHSL
jgi:hypothetical protein